MKNMKKIFLLFVMLIGCSSLIAQQHSQDGPHRHGADHRPNFEKFLSDRIAFVTKAMSLSQEDSVKFVPVYKEKLKAKGDLMFKSRPKTRIIPGQEYPDSVYLNVALREAQYKIDDAKIDMEYLKKFEQILTPKQVFKYVQAEKMFVGSFMQGGDSRQRSNKQK